MQMGMESSLFCPLIHRTGLCPANAAPSALQNDQSQGVCLLHSQEPPQSLMNPVQSFLFPRDSGEARQDHK